MILWWALVHGPNSSQGKSLGFVPEPYGTHRCDFRVDPGPWAQASVPKEWFKGSFPKLSANHQNMERMPEGPYARLAVIVPKLLSKLTEGSKNKMREATSPQQIQKL